MKKLMKYFLQILPLSVVIFGCSDLNLQATDPNSELKTDVNATSAAQQLTSTIYDFATPIQFENDTVAWKQILKKAKDQSKPIFFYGWAAWCTPCLSENYYLGHDVVLSDFLNDNYINARYMMETRAFAHVSEGWNIVDKYKINLTVYPFFLFFDSKGKLVNRYDGQVSTDDLLTIAKASSVLDNQDRIK